MPGNNRAITGRYKGQLLDDGSRHSIVIRGDDAPITSDCVFVDFFYHAGEYWTAKIPIDGIDEILGQVFNFSKVKTRKGPNGPEIIYDDHGLPRRRAPLHHLQSRFKMRSGCDVELYPLYGDHDGEPADQVDDFVYSIEAIGPTGVNFGLRDGLTGNLVSAHRFVSTQEMVFERIVVEGQHVLESAPLPLSREQKRALLLASLNRSHRAGMTEPYYLYRCCGTNNCTSNPFQLLDSAVDYTWRQRLGAMLYRLPIRPRTYLRVRGMDADPTHRKLVRSEFADYVAAPDTQKRKRAYVKSKIRALREAQASRNGDQSQRRA